MNDSLIDLLRREAARRTAVAPPAPTPERILHAVRRRRRVTVAGAAAVVLLVGAGTTVALQQTTGGRTLPAEQISPTPSLGPEQVSPTPGPDPEQAAQVHAREVVAAVVVPPGAQEVQTAPTKGLDNPSTTSSTPYQVLTTRFWTLAGTLASTQAFFHDQPENGQAVSGEGSGTGPKPTDEIVFFDYAELQVSITQVDADTIGIRADARVLWTPEKPASERVPDGVQSVEVLAYKEGAPDQVLARRTISGAVAQRLADLTNALVRDNRGGHGCNADFGYRKRLTFTTDSAQVVVDGFFCGGVLMTVDGVRQPALLSSLDLTNAIDAVLGPLPSTPPSG